jgi:hypothetical protein
MIWIFALGIIALAVLSAGFRRLVWVLVAIAAGVAVVGLLVVLFGPAGMWHEMWQ